MSVRMQQLTEWTRVFIKSQQKRAQLPLWHKAADNSHDYIRARLQDALSDRYPWQSATYDYWGSPMMQPDDDGPGCCIWAVYDDRVVVNDQDFDAYWELPYTLDAADNVTLGDPQLVKLTPVPVSMQNEEADDVKAARALAAKVGRRNSTVDAGLLKAAHDNLHSVLGMPHHELDGSAPDTSDTPDDDQGAKAALALRHRLSTARARAATLEVA